MRYFLIIALVLLAIPILWYSGFFHYEVGLFSDQDFRSGLVTEIHGMIIELVLVVFLLEWYSEKKLNKQQEPARKLAVEHLIRLHQLVFGSANIVFYPEDYIKEKKKHGFDANYPQILVEGWIRSHTTKPLDFHLNAYSKMLEYSNSALGAKLHAELVNYVYISGKVITHLKYIAESFNQGQGKYITSFDSEEYSRLEKIYQDCCKAYPDLANKNRPLGTWPITAEQITNHAKEIGKYFTHIQVDIR